MTDSPMSTSSPTSEQWWSGKHLTILACGILILLPTLALPLGQDQATFFRGGVVMLNGGTLYADFIDVKPPLIFLVYGIGGTLFGSTEFAIRLTDLLWQIGTLVALMALLVHVRAGFRWTAISVLLYAVLYATLGHAPTAQSETLFALPLVVTMYLMQRSASWQRDLGLGLMCAAAFLLKYPLAIIGPAAVFVFWLRGDGVRSAAVSAVRIGGFAFATIGLLIVPMLADPRFLPAFDEIVQYLRVYAGRDPWSLSTITLGLKSTATFFGDNVSIVVCVALVVGLLRSDRPIVWSSAVMFLFIAFSVAVERKFAAYHYSRLYIPLVLIAGVGAGALWDDAKQRWQSGSRTIKAAVLGAVAIAALFSPLPRLLNATRLAAMSISGPSAYNAYLTRPDLPGFDYNAIEALRVDLQSRLSPNDRLMLISLMATPIVPFLPTDHVGPFADAHFYHGVGARSEWKARAVDQLSQATVVVVDTIDQCTGMTLHDDTSWQAIQKDSALWGTLQRNFRCIDTVANFYVFVPDP